MVWPSVVSLGPLSDIFSQPPNQPTHTTKLSQASLRNTYRRTFSHQSNMKTVGRRKSAPKTRRALSNDLSASYRETDSRSVARANRLYIRQSAVALFIPSRSFRQSNRAENSVRRKWYKVFASNTSQAADRCWPHSAQLSAKTCLQSPTCSASLEQTGPLTPKSSTVLISVFAVTWLLLGRYADWQRGTTSLGDEALRTIPKSQQKEFKSETSKQISCQSSIGLVSRRSLIYNIARRPNKPERHHDPETPYRTSLLARSKLL